MPKCHFRGHPSQKLPNLWNLMEIKQPGRGKSWELVTVLHGCSSRNWPTGIQDTLYCSDGYTVSDPSWKLYWLKIILYSRSTPGAENSRLLAKNFHQMYPKKEDVYSIFNSLHGPTLYSVCFSLFGSELRVILLVVCLLRFVGSDIRSAVLLS